jgi:hypothetical protein
MFAFYIFCLDGSRLYRLGRSNTVELNALYDWLRFIMGGLRDSCSSEDLSRVSLFCIYLMRLSLLGERPISL